MSNIPPFKFNLPIFIIAFMIGFTYIYFNNPGQKIIIKYPTPFNTNNLMYKDSANNCYIYETTKVSCNTDPTKVVPQPIV